MVVRPGRGRLALAVNVAAFVLVLPNAVYLSWTAFALLVLAGVACCGSNATVDQLVLALFTMAVGIVLFVGIFVALAVLLATRSRRGWRAALIAYLATGGLLVASLLIYPSDFSGAVPVAIVVGSLDFALALALATNMVARDLGAAT